MSRIQDVFGASPKSVLKYVKASTGTAAALYMSKSTMKR